MNMKNVLIISLMVFVFGLSACTMPNGALWPKRGSVSPNSAVPPQQVVAADTLLVTVKAEKDVYLIGEPVYIIMKVTNNSGKIAEVSKRLRPGDGSTIIEIITPKGQKMLIAPMGETDYSTSLLIKLEYGESIGDIFPVFFNGNDWIFSEEGTYQIKAHYHVHKYKTIEKTSSAAFSIDLKKDPSGASDMLVNESADSIEAGKFLLWQAGDHLKKGHSLLNDIIEKKSDSLLASYAHFAFARSYSDSFMNYLEKEVRPPDCGRATSYRNKSKVDNLTPYIQALDAISGLRCAVITKKKSEMKQYIEKFNVITKDKVEYGNLTRVFTRYRNLK